MYCRSSAELKGEPRILVTLAETPNSGASSMDSGRATQVARKPSAPPPVTEPNSGHTVRNAGYGLPCSKCKTYFAADLTACPICKCSDRVSPTANANVQTALADEHPPDSATLEQEREKFLREFKLQVYTEH